MASRKGFTLIEVLLALVILSSVSTFIFRAFFKAVDVLSHSQNRLLAVELIHEEMALSRIQIAADPKAALALSGRKVINGRPLGYKVTSSPGSNELRKITAVVSWPEGAKKVNIAREIYFRETKEKNEE